MAKTRTINSLNQKSKTLSESIDYDSLKFGNVVIDQNGKFKFENEDVIDDIIETLNNIKENLLNARNDKLNEETQRKLKEIISNNNEDAQKLRDIFNSSEKTKTSTNEKEESLVDNEPNY